MFHHFVPAAMREEFFNKSERYLSNRFLPVFMVENKCFQQNICCGNGTFKREKKNGTQTEERHLL